MKMNRGDMENLKMIEIGSYMGESTMMFASSNIFTEIHCIEPFSGYEEFNDMYAITLGILYMMNLKSIQDILTILFYTKILVITCK